MAREAEARTEPHIKRVLMTGDTVGGVWTFTLELAEGLARRGVEVVLATLGGRPSASQAAEAAAIPKLCLLGSDFRLEWMEDPWRDVEESGWWLMDLEREYAPDVIHFNSFGHGALPWSTPTVLTAHSCVLSWWAAVKRVKLPEGWKRYRDEVARSLASVELITAPSRAMAAELTRHYGVESTACRVIPNGRSASKFPIGEKEPLILAAGRVWDEAKNIAAVARVAPGLAWPVYVAGPTGGSQQAGCRVLGPLGAPDMARWYVRASVYVAPARYEPFGLSALEAALSGCALVLGDIDSLREIWDDAALFVAPDDAAGLRAALETLIADRGLREKMASRARARALTFDADRMTEGYLEGYRSAMKVRSEQCVS